MSRKPKNSWRVLLLKLVSLIILILIILALLTTVGLHYFLSSGQVKKKLINQAQQWTGRQVTINKVNWSVFPTPHLELNNIKISNPKSFQQPHFATIKHAAVGIQIWPLFSHRLVVSKAEIDGANLNLIQNKHGKTNWQFHPKTQSPSSDHQNSNRSQNSKQAENSALDNFSLYVPNLRLHNTNIDYINQVSKQHISLQDIQFEALHIQPHKHFPIELKMALKLGQSEPKWTINYNGQLEFSPRLQFIQLDQGRLLLKPQRTDIPGITVKSIQAQFKWYKPFVELPNLSAQLAGGKITANGKLKLVKPHPSQFNLQLKHINLNQLLMNLANYRQIKGKLSAKTNLHSQGLQYKKLLQNLDGEGNIGIKQAQWRKLNLGKIYNQGLSILQHSGHFKDQQPQPETEPSGHLHADYTINNGLLSSHNLSFTSQFIQIKGQGHANLVNQQMKLSLNMVGKHNNQTYGPKVPVIVKGSMSDPGIQPDVQKIAQRYLKQSGQMLKQSLQNLSDGSEDVTQAIDKLLP